MPNAQIHAEVLPLVYTMMMWQGYYKKNVEAVIQVLEDFNISYETWDQLIMNNLLMETKMQKEYKVQVLNHNFRRAIEAEYRRLHPEHYDKDRLIKVG